MLRGYDTISSVVKTPTIVYHRGKEVAYDLIKGKNIKDMITEGDPKSSEAVRLLGRELETLHRSKSAPPKYKRGNSPDERRIIQDIVLSLEKDQIAMADVNGLIKLIKKYVPKNKSIIHGDAHLGNFIYSDKGELYYIDPDNVKISDYNADIGKVVCAIDQLGLEGKISPTQASKLEELFLAEYNGEDPDAVNIYKARTPLIYLKYRPIDVARKILRKASSLNTKVATACILIALFLIVFSQKRSITGQAIGDLTSSGSLWLVVIITILGFMGYLILNKKHIK